MLQQTQVATVIPYFERFLQRFPTLADLAAASEQEVLRLWEGLGYYRRARHLHQTARLLVSQHGGQFPDDPDTLRQLPGIGRYTLGAILSQAFDRRLPILEANSQRLLCRLLGQRQDPRTNPLRRSLWQLAETLLPQRHAGEFNQALMELGALVCTSGTPHCHKCPLTDLCEANRLGLQEVIPRRPDSPQVVEVDEVAVVVRRARQVFLVQRPGEGRWAGLWEFPHGPSEKGESPEKAARRLLAQLTGLRAWIGPEILTVRHSITRFRITLVCREGRFRSGTFHSKFYQQGRWVNPGDLYDYPVSTPQRRLARALSDRIV
jgi:A/G-specific adenine glycosylase